MAAPDPSAALDVALDRVVQLLTPTTQEWEHRKQLVSQHVQLLATQLNSPHPHPMRISPFGSSLSGLCLADSDIDLGLFGRFKGCQLDSLQPRQQQALLRMVLKAIQDARLAKHRVQGVWGARVPVLKYTCSLSGLECDISLQGIGALVKAHVMHALNRSGAHLSALYRLVKLWAQAHDLNDASRSTFNSTSLLYMTIFYLQQLQMLPPLRELVPAELLRQPEERLLQGPNKALWEDPRQLQLLLDAVHARAADWQQRYQQHQQQQPAPRLGCLLQGFFHLWSGPLSDWVLSRNRDLHADLWNGTWAPGSFAKPYIFSLQDPFDASDCPARAVGSETNNNGGTAAFIAYMFNSSSRVMQRYSDNCRAAATEAAAAAAGGAQLLAQHMQPHAVAQQISQHWRRSSGGSVGEEPHTVQQSQQQRQQHELCKALGWLFGPQAVLLLGCEPNQQHCNHHSSRLPLLPVHPGLAWAQQPFQPNLLAALQQRQKQQQQQPGKQQRQADVLTWLVEQLGAALDPARNVLSLAQLSLLFKQSLAAASEARSARQAARRGKPADAAAAGAAAGAGGVHRAHGLPHGTAVAAAAAAALSDVRQQHIALLLDGPPLSQPDVQLLALQEVLAAELHQPQFKMRKLPDGGSPKHLPKALKKAVQESMRLVGQRITQLEIQQQLEQGEQSGSSSSSVHYGLMAVLQQHGFVPLLEQWGFVKEGVLWQQLLPHLTHHTAGPAAGTAAAAAAPAAAPAAAEAAAGLARAPIRVPALHDTDRQQPVAAAACSDGRPTNVLLQLLGKKDPAAGLKLMYKTLSSANKCALQAAGGRKVHPTAADAVKAEAVQLDSWRWFNAEEQVDLKQPGSGSWCCCVNLPPLCLLQRQKQGQGCCLQQLLPGCVHRVLLNTPGPLMLRVPEGAAHAAAREALDWLAQQPGVVETVAAAMASTHPQPLQQQQQQQEQGSQQQQQRQEQQLGRQQSAAALQGVQALQPQQLRPQAGRGKQRDDVRVVEVVAANGQPAAAAVAMAAAAQTAAAAAAAALAHPLSPQRNRQQQQHPQQKEEQTAASADLTGRLSSLSVQPTSTIAAEVAAPQAAEGEAALNADTAAEAAAAAALEEAAAKQYRHRLRTLQDQIKAMQRRLQLRMQSLQENGEFLAELQGEEAAALQAAGLGPAAASNSSSSSSSVQKSAADAPDASGALLLGMALQQSTEGKLKELRHELHCWKMRVQQSKESLRQLQVNLQKLQDEQAAVQAGGPSVFLAALRRQAPVATSAAASAGQVAAAGAVATAGAAASNARRAGRRKRAGAQAAPQ